ncbi:hypothetical protein LXL04_012454 [Taraxacum kok-saghyz]
MLIMPLEEYFKTHQTSRLSDVTTLAVGYLFILSLIVFYIGVIALIRYTRGEPLTMGRFYGIASIAETIPSLFRQFLAAMRHLMRMIKVAFLLVIELGVFPPMCGWWLDICTIRMFGKSISQRVDFFSVLPLASSLIHWVVGIVYMLQISIFASLLRGERPRDIKILSSRIAFKDPCIPNTWANHRLKVKVIRCKGQPKESIMLKHFPSSLLAICCHFQPLTLYAMINSSTVTYSFKLPSLYL